MQTEDMKSFLLIEKLNNVNWLYKIVSPCIGRYVYYFLFFLIIINSQI